MISGRLQSKGVWGTEGVVVHKEFWFPRKFCVYMGLYGTASAQGVGCGHEGVGSGMRWMEGCDFRGCKSKGTEGPWGYSMFILVCSSSGNGRCPSEVC